MKTRKNKKKRRQPCGPARKVAVFGAGITGLTVAHELAERGFEVDVYDPSLRIGGIASSQYNQRPAPCNSATNPCCCNENTRCGDESMASALSIEHPRSVLRFIENADPLINGELIVEGSVGFSLWRSDTGERLLTGGDREQITALDVSNDRQWVLTGSEQGNVKLWNIKDDNLDEPWACIRPCPTRGAVGPVLDVRLEQVLNDDGTVDKIALHALYGACQIRHTNAPPESLPTVTVETGESVWLGQECILAAAPIDDPGTFVVVEEKCCGEPLQQLYKVPDVDEIHELAIAEMGDAALLLHDDNTLTTIALDGDTATFLGRVRLPHSVAGMTIAAGLCSIALVYENGTIEWRDIEDPTIVIKRGHIVMSTGEEVTTVDFLPSAEGILVGTSMNRFARYTPSVGVQDITSNFGAPIHTVAMSPDGRFMMGMAGPHDALQLRTWDMALQEEVHWLQNPFERERTGLMPVDGPLHTTKKLGSGAVKHMVIHVDADAPVDDKTDGETFETQEHPPPDKPIRARLTRRGGGLSLALLNKGVLTQHDMMPFEQGALETRSNATGWLKDDCEVCLLPCDPCARASRGVLFPEPQPFSWSPFETVRGTLGGGLIVHPDPDNIAGLFKASEHAHRITALDAVFHPGNPTQYTLLIGREDGTVEVVARDGSGQASRTIRQLHKGPVTSARIVPGGRGALTGGMDRRLVVWDFPESNLTSVFAVRDIAGGKTDTLGPMPGPVLAMDFRVKQNTNFALLPGSRFPTNDDKAVVGGLWRKNYELAVAVGDTTYRTQGVSLWDMLDGQRILDCEPHPWKLLPGEHGFRFFPAFYRHLFDTMKRTTMPGYKYRSVADNLVSTVNQGIAMEDGQLSHEFTRTSTASTENMVRTLYRMMSGLRYTLADIVRFQIKLIKFMTSSKLRRETYQDISWWDFIEGPRYTPEAQYTLNTVPRVLVAMDAIRGDALTQGLIMVQLLMDQVEEGEDTDRVLNGPTSEVWFNHWQAHLEGLGVKFHLGFALEELSLNLDRTEVKCAQVRQVSTHHGECCQVHEPDLVRSDFFVLATPPRVARAVVRGMKRRYKGSWKPRGDLKKLLKYNISNSESWMSGIQFYLSDDVPIVRGGHIYYPDSPWGLSSVSQPQFWRENVRGTYGVGGVVSVILGDWERPVPLNTHLVPQRWWQRSAVAGKTARECTPDELAREVWRQINMSANGQSLIERREVRGRTDLPDPLFYALDDGLDFSGPLVENRSLYIIAPVGDWNNRPGKIDNLSGYDLQAGNLVLAGNYMKTHTRLTIMESANESGRHATNAVLCAPKACFSGERTAIYPIDRWEPRDTIPLKQLDKALFEAGLPHFLDILDVMGLIDTWFAKHPDEPLGAFLTRTCLGGEVGALLSQYVPAIDAASPTRKSRQRLMNRLLDDEDQEARDIWRQTRARHNARGLFDRGTGQGDIAAEDAITTYSFDQQDIVSSLTAMFQLVSTPP